MQFPSCHLSVINRNFQRKQRYMWTKAWHGLAAYILYLSKLQNPKPQQARWGCRLRRAEGGVQCSNRETVYVSIGMLRTTVKDRKVSVLNQAWSQLRACPYPAPPPNIEQIQPLLGKEKQKARYSCAAQSLGTIPLCTRNNPWSCCLGNSLAIKRKYWYLIKLVN